MQTFYDSWFHDYKEVFVHMFELGVDAKLQ